MVCDRHRSGDLEHDDGCLRGERCQFVQIWSHVSTGPPNLKTLQLREDPLIMTRHSGGPYGENMQVHRISLRADR